MTDGPVVSSSGSPENTGPSVSPEAEAPLGLMGWIAAYKLLKAVAAIFFATVSLRLINRNLTLLALEWMERLEIRSQGRFAAYVLKHVARIDTHRLHLIAALLFFYTLIYATEGIGLFYKKRWAEWLTVVQTGVLLPWEIYEIVLHRNLTRFFIFLANLAVVFYLVWRIRRDDRMLHIST
jgi:uncharacterized membrane protein (DUF2068 family)